MRRTLILKRLFLCSLYLLISAVDSVKAQDTTVIVERSQVKSIDAVFFNREGMLTIFGENKRNRLILSEFTKNGKFGQLLNYRRFTNSYGSVACVNKKVKGDYISVTRLSESAQSEYKIPHLCKFDKAGNLIWSFKFSNWKKNTDLHLAQGGAKKSQCCVSYLVDPFDQLDFVHLNRIKSFDMAKDKELWEQKLDFEVTQIQSDEEGWLVTGVLDKMLAESKSDRGYQWILEKYDFKGNKIWRKILYNSKQRIYWTNFTQNTKGEWFGVVRLEMMQTFGQVENSPSVVLMKMSSSGEVLWRNGIYADNGIADDDDQFQLLPKKDGSVLVIGELPSYSIGKNKRRSGPLFLAKFNETGTLEWNRNYETDTFYFVMPAKAIWLQNEKMAIAATAIPHKQKGYIFKKHISLLTFSDPQKINPDYGYSKFNKLACVKLDENGIEHGNYLSQYINGQIAESGTYKNGLKNGEWKSFQEDGTLSSTESYSVGFKQGKQYQYHSNGNLKIEKEYSMNVLTFEQTYYSSGKLKKQSTYINGRTDGTSTEYFENEKPKVIENYSYGGRDGVWNSYYENGQLKSTETYYSKIRQGEVKFWYRNGVLKELGNYNKYAQQDGEWIKYDSTGQLVEKRIYITGRLMKTIFPNQNLEEIVPIYDEEEEIWFGEPEGLPDDIDYTDLQSHVMDELMKTLGDSVDLIDGEQLIISFITLQTNCPDQIKIVRSINKKVDTIVLNAFVGFPNWKEVPKLNLNLGEEMYFILKWSN